MICHLNGIATKLCLRSGFPYVSDVLIDDQFLIEAFFPGGGVVLLKYEAGNSGPFVCPVLEREIWLKCKSFISTLGCICVCVCVCNRSNSIRLICSKMNLHVLGPVTYDRSSDTHCPRHIGWYALIFALSVRQRSN